MSSMFAPCVHVQVLTVHLRQFCPDFARPQVFELGAACATTFCIVCLPRCLCVPTLLESLQAHGLKAR
eukprot:15475079-Alexandrium_andersonii.AAC.1